MSDDKKDTGTTEKVKETEAAKKKRLAEEKAAEEKAAEAAKKAAEDLAKKKAKELAAAKEAEAKELATVEKKYEDDKAAPRQKRFVCKVQHLMAESKSERDMPIPVNDLGDHAHGKAICYPGKEVVLSQVQINILEDAIEQVEMTLPDNSGVHEEANPLAAAEKLYPSFKARRNRHTGAIVIYKHDPRFSVITLRPYDPEVEKAKAEAREKR